MCDKCAKLDKKFKVYKKRQSTDDVESHERRSADSSNVNLRYLSKEELIERLNNTQQKKRMAIKSAARLSKRIHELTQKEGIQVK